MNMSILDHMETQVIKQALGPHRSTEAKFEAEQYRDALCIAIRGLREGQTHQERTQAMGYTTVAFAKAMAVLTLTLLPKDLEGLLTIFVDAIKTDHAEGSAKLTRLIEALKGAQC